MSTSTSIAFRCLLGTYALFLLNLSCFAEEEVEEIVVQGVSVSQSVLDSSSISLVDEETIELVAAFHPSEILARVPGVWVTRNSGQEHLTAIRSGVLTGTGACGAFLLLENGIPVRPAGFCNVNGLFEINTEQASQLEVIRGPASSRYGGNALYGVINAVTFATNPSNQIGFRLGSDQFRQVRLETGNESVSFRGHATNDGGYRDQTGLEQYKANLELSKQVSNWQVDSMFSVTRLDQETGGYVRGFRAYRDASTRFSNPNPEAYRNASSMRFTSLWQQTESENPLTLTPYLRSSSMEFLQHFLPGQPLEENSQTSAGIVARKSLSSNDLMWNVGGQIEFMDGDLRQSQASPTTGSAFLVATRPPGTHYDYSVQAQTFAAFYDLIWQIQENTQIHHLARIELLKYDYTNHHLVGNTKNDGTACGFGGCLYSRPADRTDSFSNIGFNIGIEHSFDEMHQVYGLIANGFRPPQSTELYRLQSGQQIADLKSENLWSIEVGFRRQADRLAYQLSFFSTKARNLVLRDSEGFNVSLGKTVGRGIEWDLQLSLSDSHLLSIVGTRVQHEYDFTRIIARGEQITAGNELDSAPSTLGSVHWIWDVSDAVTSELEFSYVGKHVLNAANTAMYDGHYALNWYGSWETTKRFSVQYKVTNLLDRKYADRGDFAFGGYRYFPAPPRQFMVGVQYHMN